MVEVFSETLGYKKRSKVGELCECVKDGVSSRKQGVEGRKKREMESKRGKGGGAGRREERTRLAFSSSGDNLRDSESDFICCCMEFPRLRELAQSKVS